MEITLSLLYAAGCAPEPVAAERERAVVAELEEGGCVVAPHRISSAQLLRPLLRDDRLDFDVAVCAAELEPGEVLEILEAVHAANSRLPVIALSAGAGEATGVELMRAGVCDVVPADESGELWAAVQRALEESRVYAARQQAERAAGDEASRQRGLCELLSTVLDGRDCERLLERAVEGVGRVLGLPICLLSRSVAAGGRLEVAAGFGLGDEPWPAGAGLESGPGTLAAFVLEAEGVVEVEDLAGESRFASPLALARIGVRSGLFVAVRTDDGSPAVLAACATRARHFSRAEVSHLASVAEIVANGWRMRAASRAPELAALWRASQPQRALGRLCSELARDFDGLLERSARLVEAARVRLPPDGPQRSEVDALTLEVGRLRGAVEAIRGTERGYAERRVSADLGSVVEEVREMLAGLLPAAVSVRCEKARGLPPALVNLRQVREALVDLALDAIGATPGAGDLVLAVDRVGGEEPGPSGTSIDAAIRLTVSRAGGGAHRLQSERAEEVRRGGPIPEDGGGPGLLLARQAAEGHGGRLRVRGARGIGTSVELHFPVSDVRAAPAGPGRSPATQPRTPGDAARILIVDDDPAIARLARRLLERLGHAVETFTDSHEALEHFLREPAAVDVVISDYAMPALDGLALAHELGRLRPELPIILTSGYGDGLAPEQLEREGIEVVLAKPFHGAELARAVERARAIGPEP